MASSEAISLNPVQDPNAVADGLDLLDRARRGDAEAFGALCRLHGARLYRHAVGLSGDPGEAEDLVQETFMAAWGSLPRYHGGCRFFTWLCSILIHLHLRLVRRRRWWSWARWKGDTTEAEAEALESVVDPGATPDVSAKQAERARALLRSVRQLPAKQREVVYLRFYAGESLEGIAVAVGCSLGTVKSRLFHGLERLRRMHAVVGQHQP